MKILKGLSIFFLFVVLFGSCFDPPEYSVVPQIEFNKIEFVEAPGLTNADTIVLYIDFKDGDGDLGLSADLIDEPYNSNYFFLEDGTGELTQVSTFQRYTNLPPFIKVDLGDQGQLATVRTRNKPGYSSLPAYIDPFRCSAYRYDSLFVSEEDKSIFEGTDINIKRILSNSTQPDVYVLLDTFYYALNPNYNNIEVDFLIKNTDGSGTYTEFDWNTVACNSTFDGRFPVLADKPRVVEGTLKYNMQSIGFLQLFSVKVMKLRIRVRDRALNESNVIETPDFTLNDIRR